MSYCHTLISSRNDHLQTFGFLPAELNNLTLIVAQSIEFCDISEGNVQNIQKKGKRVTFGAFSAPGPTRKLRDEVTSSPGRAKLAWASKLLQEESSSSPRRAAMQPPPLISYK